MSSRREATTAPPFFAASIDLHGFVHAARKLWLFTVLGLAPIAFAALLINTNAKLGLLGFDFKGTIWQPGREILAGHSPYPPPVPSKLNTGNPSVYPPLAIVLTLPFALLPFTAAYVAWTATLVTAILATLWILGVRDWRCYTLAVATCPIVTGFTLGNIVVLLVLIAALAWRYRNDARWSGLAVGVGIALKLVLWPLIVWFVATRRWRAAFVAACSAVITTLAAWAPLRFDGLLDYPHLLSVNNDVYASHSWSLFAGFIGLGLPSSAAGALSSVAGFVLLLSAFVFARQPDGERRAYLVVILASIVLLPIVWTQSLALLLVPLALFAPRADRSWFLFMSLWVAAALPRTLATAGTTPPGVPRIVWRMEHSPPPTGQIAVFVLLTGLLALVLLRSPRRTAETQAALPK